MPSHDLHASYLDYLARTGRGNTAYWTAARSFFARWPDPAAWADEPLPVRLSANGSTRPLITFLILHGGLRPGYDYLLERKFSSSWREVQGCQVGTDLALFLSTAEQLGFAERVRLATASQVPARLLIQTGRPLNRLTDRDIDAFTYACVERRNEPATDGGTTVPPSATPVGCCSISRSCPPRQPPHPGSPSRIGCAG
ncbi:hypothetical protein [Solwaraspora sp. WMMA2065]|uniref:hypothetical protein n=1 Tax=Solwaraspora sp. WMMA2065 TaxID=3015166 RepID=UPI00259B3139|nr:hypothetical protein [Solwaraspora sp. WMMA2065]WJK35496.1 hypothetical protein O7610_03700 [Solwaraspora sp. WMMA2065]